MLNVLELPLLDELILTLQDRYQAKFPYLEFFFCIGYFFIY